MTLFKQQPLAYKKCEELLLRAPNDNVIFFSLSVYEEFIRKHYALVPKDEQLRVKDQMLYLLQQSLNSGQATLTPRSINKLIKIIVDIGKHVWPQDFPDLLQIIHTLILTKDTKNVGLMLLRTMVEEFTATQKKDMDSDRRQSLLMSFNEFLPSILLLMKQILEGVYHDANDGSNQVSAGGTHARSLTSKSYNFQSNNVSSSVNALTLSLNTPVVPDSKLFDQSHADGAVVAMEVIQLTVTHINNYWSKIPQQDYVSSDLLEILMIYSRLNDAQNIRLGVSALNVIAEIVEKKNIRFSNKNEFVGVISKHLLQLLQGLTRVFDISTNSLFLSNDLDEDYRLKLVDFMKVYIRNCYSLASEFVEPLFELIYRFTFNSNDIFWLGDMIELWHEFLLEYYGEVNYVDVRSALSGQPVNSQKVLQIIHMKNGLVVLGKDLLKKSLYESNGSELSRIIADDDDEFAGEEGFEGSESSITRRVLQIVVRIIEYFPDDFLGELSNAFMAKKADIDKLSGRSLKSLSMDGLAQVNSSMLDLTTIVGIFGKINELLSGFDEQCFGLLQSLASLTGSLINIRAGNAKVLTATIEGLIKENVMVIGSFSGFLVKIKQSNEFHEFMNGLLPMLIHLMTSSTETYAKLVATRVFMSVCESIKPERLFEYNRVADFFNNVHELTVNSDSDEFKKICYRAVSCGILKCTPGNNEAIQKQLESFLSGLIVPFSQVAISELNMVSLQPRLIHVLLVLSSVIGVVQQERLAIRNNTYAMIHSADAKIMEVYRILLSTNCNVLLQNSHLILCLLDFTLSYVECFRSNLNASKDNSVKELVQNLFTYLQNNVSTLLQSDQKFTVELLSKYFLLLKTLVDNNNVDSMLTVLFWGLDIAFKHNSLDSLRVSLLDTLHSIVISKFKLINAGAQEGVPSVKLVRILSIYAQCFSANQLELFQKALYCLEDLNAKHLVFTKYFGVFYEGFCQVLLDNLVQQNFDLLRDELIRALFQIFHSRTQAFYDQLLVEYLDKTVQTPAAKIKILSGLNKAGDFPSFSEQLNRVVNDIIYVQGLNSQ